MIFYDDSFLPMIHYIKFIRKSQPLSSLRSNNLVFTQTRSWLSEQKQVPMAIQEHRFFKMLKDLQNQSYVLELIKQETKLREIPEGRYASFKHLKLKINDLLHLWRLIIWAQAYHTSLPVSSLSKAIDKIEQLFEEAFTEKINHTLENLHQERLEGYSGINFSLYYDMAPTILPQISEIYLNAYLHLNRQHWPLEMVRVREAIKDQSISALEKMIIDKSNHFLTNTVDNIMANLKEQRCLDDLQMALFLAHNKNKIDQLSEQQRYEVKEQIMGYLLRDDNKNSFIHLENILYCLFLSVNSLQMTETIYQWLSFKRKDKKTNIEFIYISNIYSHEDKASCLKVDIWMAILRHSLTKAESERDQQLEIVVQEIVLQLRMINFSIWKFKYQAWMFDTVITYLDSNTETVQIIIKAITLQTLASHHVLPSFLSSFISYTSHKGICPHILRLQQAASSWLCSQSNSSLLSQPAPILCEILPHADRHPALQSLYSPYLNRLLDLSLGQFEWTVLNQLYYFGLRWKCNTSEDGYWRMQYVRRYIMNEYAEMGIRRREIPEDSYFYKIHEETTPEEFYRNFLERQ